MPQSRTDHPERKQTELEQGYPSLGGRVPVQFCSHSPLQNSSLLPRWALCVLAWPDTIGPAGAVAVTPFVVCVSISLSGLVAAPDVSPTFRVFASLLGPV